MQLPFTHQQFLDVFATYHRFFWPVVPSLWVATLAVLVFWWRRGTGASPMVAGLLAFHWAWSGVAYHFTLFRAINPAASIFAAMFVAQAVLIFWTGVVRRRLIFTPSGRGWGAVGLGLVAYAMAYPGLVALSGLSYPEMPTFGLPCPSTILTAGLLFFLAPSAARIPAWITVAWSGIGGSAAFVLGIRPDLALPVAGGLVLIHALRRVRREPPGWEDRGLHARIS